MKIKNPVPGILGSLASIAGFILALVILPEIHPGMELGQSLKLFILPVLLWGVGAWMIYESLTKGSR